MRRAFVFVLLLASAWPQAALAYPWMIRHHYASCAACHVDPSGGGLITPYGRAQAELLVTMQYRQRAEDEELPARANFLFGAVDLPEWANLGFSFRGGALINRVDGVQTVRPLQMASDLRAAIQYEQFRAGAALGFAIRRALPASLTQGEENNLVTREHWLGFTSEDQSLFLRAGRMSLPFGLRNVEHTTWVRDVTRTDINEDQQHGVAMAYNGERTRGELMAVIGNLQLNPSQYRERGYSGFFEFSLNPDAAVGVSSLMTHARYDVPTRAPYYLRQSHGVFGRWAVNEPLVLMAEIDALVTRPQGQVTSLGSATMFQADLEPVQGLHFIATAETLRQNQQTSVGGWLSAAWFFASHSEIRIDSYVRRTQTATEPLNVVTVIAQLHLLL